jgi:uncharacterized membrane protein YgdD (TMEM256/DUF423 family)
MPSTCGAQLDAAEREDPIRASARPRVGTDASVDARRRSKLPGREIRVDRTFLWVGGAAGFIGVALGAFGAHGLRTRLSAEMLTVFETGVRYQMYHALAILIVALAAARLDGWLIRSAGWLFTAGIVLFSGSLYALALSGVTVLGAVTPLGGLAFLAGWAALVIASLRI